MGPLPSSRTRLGLVAFLVAIGVASTACSASSHDQEQPATSAMSTPPDAATATPGSVSPLPTPSPTPDPPPKPEAIDVTARQEVSIGAAPGVDMGGASGHSLTIPTGWTVEVWANVPGARIAAWAPDGRLVVSSASQGTVVTITPQGPGGGPAVSTIVAGLAKPQGLAFGRIGNRDVLVIGEENAITAWDYVDGAMSNRRVLVGDLPTDGHGAKGLAIDGQTVYYSLGSSGNRTPADRISSPERAVIAQVLLDGSGNAVVAHGVRNGFGLGIAPDGTLFTAVNQSDNQRYPYRDETGRYGKVISEFVNENPLEQVTRVTSGGDVGWPYCFPDAQSSRAPVLLAYVADPETNPDSTVADCTVLARTSLGLPAHSAPLDIEFTQGTALEDVLGLGALIGVHGSWNRTPPREPAVLWAPWDGTRDNLAPAVPLVTGFQNADGSRWGRAVSAVPGADGARYVTDDAAGLVYRLVPGGS